ncbi:hypothetical protein AB0K40_12755 [Nonomuraea bangladeshensis]|uniref:ABC transporter permease n=1 Tax=Nonomuraea bangladeshensis TaxID=404385 RepID=A0ABV3H240_9ACTN
MIERRSAAPLLRLGLLRSGPLVRANLAGLLFAGAFFGFQFIAVLYQQELRGWSSLQTSLAMLARTRSSPDPHAPAGQPLRQRIRLSRPVNRAGPHWRERS